MPRWLEPLRTLAQRVPAWAVAGAALAIVVALSYGGLAIGTSFKGYAESQSFGVGPLRAGRVKTLAVDVGWNVKPGDTLATMEDDEIAARLDRTREELSRVQAQLATEAESQAVNAERERIRLLLGRADEQKDRADLQELSAQLQRVEALASEQLIPATELESVRRRHAAAKARVESYGAASDVSMTALPALPASIAARIEPFRAAVRAQEAQLRGMESEVRDLVLRASVQGAVSDLNKRPGEVAGAGVPVVTVVSARKGYVVTWVPESVARGIQKGSAARVARPVLFGGSFHGIVIAVAPNLDEFPVRFRAAPAVPAWGRRVMIQVEGESDLLPGEMLYVRL